MVFSLLLLRYRGNHVCRIAREILIRSGTQFTELYLGEDVITKADGVPMCRLLINGTTLHRDLWFLIRCFECGLLVALPLSSLTLFLGRDIGNIPRRLERFKPMEEDFLEMFFKYICRKWRNARKQCCEKDVLGPAGSNSEGVEMVSFEVSAIYSYCSCFFRAILAKGKFAYRLWISKRL